LNARFSELSAMALSGSSVDFGKLLADETQKWAEVIRFSGARAD